MVLRLGELRFLLQRRKAHPESLVVGWVPIYPVSNARHALSDKDRPRIAHGSRLDVIQPGGRRRDAALLAFGRIEGFFSEAA